MDNDTTQTLDDTQANEQKPYLVIRFAGCDMALWCELHDLGPNSIPWETMEEALLSLPKGWLNTDENGEAPIMTISAKMMDPQMVNNSEEWYC